MFQLQDAVKAAEKRVLYKKKVLSELESFEKLIGDSRGSFNSQKKLFTYLMFERFSVKEKLLMASHVRRIDELVDVFRPKEEENEDENNDAGKSKKPE